MSETDFTVPSAPADLRRLLPHAEQAAPFMLAYAGDWTMFADGVPRPSLRMYRLESGQHGIGESIRDNVKRQIHHLDGALEGYRQTPLPLSMTSARYGSYAKRFDAWSPRSNAKVVSFRQAWDVPRVGRAETKLDTAIFDDFIALWRENGLVAYEVDELWVARRISDLDKRLGKARTRDPHGAAYRTRAIAWELRAWEAVRDGAAPVPQDVTGTPATAPAVPPAKPAAAPAKPAAKASTAAPAKPSPKPSAAPAKAPATPPTQAGDFVPDIEPEDDDSAPSMSVE